jgi:uncharacterized protein YjlB
MKIVNADASFSHHILAPGRVVPNNLNLPVICYKNVLQIQDDAETSVKKLFAQNGWKDAWTDGIFTYHHYHSTAHEVLAVISGDCMIELGGEDGNIQKITTGDVVVLPAGVVHKNVGASADFVCIGAYPDGQQYDMNYCKEEEMEDAIKNIEHVPLPSNDPVFGDKGPVIELWKMQSCEKKMIAEEPQF